ncbi:MAG: ABC transporter permease [Actinomycetota bacterium]|nr:ABC transporter permease [Actinomycetota bacterium]
MAASPATMPTAHVRERPSWLEPLLVQAAALLLALLISLLIGAVIIILYGEDPIDVYGAILEFAFRDATSFGTVLSIATPLIFSALAVAVCFKAGLFNIGVEGQFLVGMVTATWAALHLDFLPGPLLAIGVLVFAMLGGMAFAAIPAVLKVKTGAHEVVTTIMLNGIAISFLAWALNGPLKYTAGEGAFNVDLRSDKFADNALMPNIGALFGMKSSADLSLLLPLGLVAAALVWFLFKRMRLGYEARAVGSSPGSAQAGGISIGAVQIKLFLISGALAGLIGMQQLLVDKGALVQNYEAQLGFIGIGVAFLGQNNPIGIVFAAIFWGILSRGESALQINTDVPREFVIILQGIFIMTVVIVYQVAKRWAARRQLAREGMIENIDGSVAAVDIDGLSKEDA